MHILRCALACAALAAGAVPVSAQSAFAGAPIDDTQLGRIAGQADLTQIAGATNSGVVSGNTINGDSVNGSVRFDPGSFAGMNGLAILSANTGSNVAINSAMTVNVSIHP